MKIKLCFYFTLLCFLGTAHGLVYGQHADDPDKQEEHEALMNLVPVSEATHIAVKSGNWSKASTWKNGKKPEAGAKVHIPEGITVKVNVVSTASLKWIRVDGTITFVSTVNSQLIVDTFIIMPKGTINIGTSQSPIAASKTVKIIFSDGGAISTSSDPLKLGRGLISHGITNIYGAPVTPFIEASASLAVGATSVTLQATPVNWKVGDQIVITAIKRTSGDAEDEVRTIKTISGSTVTWEGGLKYARSSKWSDLQAYVANTTRNIIFQSANTTTHSRKGHIMFMHNPKATVQYAGFYNVGRTSKKDVVTDKFADNGRSPSDNPRGRYPVHFHRTGHHDKTSTPAVVKGCAVVNSPGWGYVNHDSHVIFEDNVSYNVLGAHYVTELGGELGAFRRNIAIYSEGAGNGIEKDRSLNNHDLGHAGHGFWLQSGSVEVIDNVTTSHREAGFTFFTRGKTSQYMFATKNLRDPAMGGGAAHIKYEDIPFYCKGNTDYASSFSFNLVDIEINGKGPTKNILEDFVSLNARGFAGIFIEYTRNLYLTNVRVLRDQPGDKYRGNYGVNCHNLYDHRFPFATRSPIYVKNLTVSGYQYGIRNWKSSDNDNRGEAVDMAKVVVLDNSLTFEVSKGNFADSGGADHVVYEKSSDMLPLPTLSPAPGTYNANQTVKISSVSGATIYYMIENQGAWPSVAEKLNTANATVYKGPISISGEKILYVFAKKKGVPISPVYAAYYTIDPDATTTSTARASFEVIQQVDADVVVYPVPASDYIRVNFTAQSAGKAHVAILNAVSQSQIQVDKPVVQGQNTVEVYLGRLKKGLHFVVVEVEGKRITKKITIE